MITYHPELIQGSDEWLAARCGMITASTMDLILTPTLKMASNEKERTHLYELLAQRVTSYVEPAYISDDMLRGQDEEIEAKALYSEKFNLVTDTGFVTNDEFGFVIGYSPDGLVGNEGQVECKSRRHKYHIQTILEGECPRDFMLQVQTGLLVTQRKWCDFISYCGGLPMFVTRVFPDDLIQDAIRVAASAFNDRLWLAQNKYEIASRNLIPTQRREREEIVA